MVVKTVLKRRESSPAAGAPNAYFALVKRSKTCFINSFLVALSIYPLRRAMLEDSSSFYGTFSDRPWEVFADTLEEPTATLKRRLGWSTA